MLRGWTKWLACAALLGAALAVQAQEQVDIQLPPPRQEGGMPLLAALKLRQSARAFAPDALAPQMLSDLLWAAAGINRPESGKRTAPTARNWQEVDVYVVLAEGAYRYDAQNNVLRAVASGDLRALTGTQDFVAGAPVNLVFVVDTTRMAGVGPGEQQTLYAGTDTGFISENVYLFCASEGLATVVRGSVDREKLGTALRLAPEQRIILAQTVGYPAGR